MIDCIASDIGFNFNWIGYPFQDNLMATRPFQAGVAAGIIGYDPNFEPHTRARSNTWPCPRPEIIKEEVEEESPVDILLNSNSQQQHNALQLNQLQGPGPGPGPGIPGTGQQQQQQQLNSSSLGQSSIPPPIPEYSTTTTTSNTSSPGQAGVGVKKSTSSRRNAWGNMSYADLITQAIGSSPEKRLTLSQIYDWMVGNVPYFKDKGDSNSSAGWKNSIRHNLSLHNRFMRVQNEGTGKSSWWMLNPDAKPGKAARRRATSMETSKFEKKRGRIRKKLENLRNGVVDSPGSSLSEGLDIFPGPGTVDDLVVAGGNYIGSSANLSPDFRPRASSNASSCGRLSPIIRENVDLHDNQVPPMSPWGGDYYTPSSSHYERYLAEEALAGNLANNMKLGGEPLNSPDFSFHHSPGGNSEQNYATTPQQQFRRGTLGENDYSAYTAYTSQAQNGGTNAVGVNGVGGNGGANHVVVEPKADLDFIEQLDTSFDCNVEEVLQNELSLGSDIDFNFGTVGAHHVLAHAHLQQQHQAQQTMMFNPSNSALHHHLMNSPLMGSNGSSLLTAGGGGNNPDVTVVTTSSPSGRPWVH